MVRRRGRPSPTWRSFLRNQAAGIAAIDMFVVASASFRLLYVMIILAHDRRKIVRFTTYIWLLNRPLSGRSTLRYVFKSTAALELIRFYSRRGARPNRNRHADRFGGLHYFSAGLSRSDGTDTFLERARELCEKVFDETDRLTILHILQLLQPVPAG